MTHNSLNSAGHLASCNVMAGVPNLLDASHPPGHRPQLILLYSLIICFASHLLY